MQKLRCECCDKSYDKNDIVLRLQRINERGNMVGMHVCRFCSPSYDDATLLRYEKPITEWSASWCTGSSNLSALPLSTLIDARLVYQHKDNYETDKERRRAYQKAYNERRRAELKELREILESRKNK